MGDPAGHPERCERGPPQRHQSEERGSHRDDQQHDDERHGMRQHIGRQDELPVTRLAVYLKADLKFLADRKPLVHHEIEDTGEQSPYVR